MSRQLFPDVLLVESTSKQLPPVRIGKYEVIGFYDPFSRQMEIRIRPETPNDEIKELIVDSSREWYRLSFINADLQNQLRNSNLDSSKWKTERDIYFQEKKALEQNIETMQKQILHLEEHIKNLELSHKEETNDLKLGHKTLEDKYEKLEVDHKKLESEVNHSKQILILPIVRTPLRSILSSWIQTAKGLILDHNHIPYNDKTIGIKWNSFRKDKTNNELLIESLNDLFGISLEEWEKINNILCKSRNSYAHPSLDEQDILLVEQLEGELSKCKEPLKQIMTKIISSI